MKIIKLEQATQEWLDWRKSGFSASEAPSVMSESAYFPATPYQLYQVHTGQKQVVYTAAMKDGNRLEPLVLEYNNMLAGKNYKPTLIEREINGRKWLASLDGYCDEARIKVLEIKTTTLNSKIWNDGINIYKWQLTHQCIVAGVDKATLLIYAKDANEHKFVLFEMDKKDAAKLQKAWEKYGDCAESFTAPALTARDYFENDSDEWRGVAASYKEIGEEIKRLQELQAQYKDTLIELAGDQATKGAGVTVYKCARAGNVNYKAIPELQNVDLDQYRGKPTEYWVVR